MEYIDIHTRSDYGKNMKDIYKINKKSKSSSLSTSYICEKNEKKIKKDKKINVQRDVKQKRMSTESLIINIKYKPWIPTKNNYKEYKEYMDYEKYLFLFSSDILQGIVKYLTIVDMVNFTKTTCYIEYGFQNMQKKEIRNISAYHNSMYHAKLISLQRRDYHIHCGNFCPYRIIYNHLAKQFDSPMLIDLNDQRNDYDYCNYCDFDYF